MSVAVWASAFIGIRAAGRGLSPGPLALGRLLIGSMALGAVALLRRERLPRRRALAGCMISGLLWFGVYNVALNAAERRVDAGIAAILVNVAPLLIVILAGFLLREGFPPRLVAGCVVSFTGVAIIGISSSPHGIEGAWGTGFCLIAALGCAGGMVAQKPALGSTSPLAVTWVACVTGVVSCLPYAPTLVREAGQAPRSTLEWMIYLGLVPTAVGFLTWAYALAHTPAGRLGPVTYLVPPLAVTLGWGLLGEVPALLVIPGGALCLMGVALSRSSGGRLANRRHRSRIHSSAPTES